MPPRHSRLILTAVAALAALAGTSTAAAQPSSVAPPLPAAAADAVQDSIEGASLTIYLLTFGQGDVVWEKFGHNAIWVHDPADPREITYNWGMFDFNQPQFIRRFLSGNTQYWMQGIALADIMQEYRDANRTVLAQELNLAPSQRLELKRFLEWNARPENRFYRYDYFRDNCSTRVRDALDRVLGGELRRATQSVPTGTSYRSHTARLTADNLPLYTGIMLGLGHRADEPISAWDEMFLPVPMAARLRAVHITGPAGTPVPLVRTERELFSAERPPERASPPNLLAAYVAFGLIFAALLVYLVRAAERGSSPATFFAAAISVIWTFLSGFFGLVVLAAWLLTKHVYMGWNENLIQFNPLSLGLAVLIPFTVAAGWLTRGTTRLAMAIAVLSLLGFVLQGLPFWRQDNGVIIALALPLNLATAWAVYRLGHYRRISRSSSADL